MGEGYAGGAFHGSFEGGKRTGLLVPSRDSLRFEPADGAATELPWRDLVLAAGGAAGRLLFFTHPDRPGWSLFTAERAILDDPLLAAQIDLQPQLVALRGKRRRRRLSYVVALLLVVAVIWGLGWLKDRLVPVVARRVPPSVEARLGDAAFAQIKGRSRFVTDAQVRDELQRLVRPLVAGVGPQRHRFEFHIAVDPTLNAFALPGGKVVLHSGLLLAADGPEEVLGVLAHEIAHVTQQHSLRQLVQSIGLWLVLQALLGDINSLAGVLVDRGGELLAARFSRDHERDADAVGWDFLLRAGVDPRGMTRFFERMLDARPGGAAGQVAEGALNFLSTHPTTRERIESLQARWAALPAERRYFSRSDLDYARFKDRLRASLGK